VPEKRINWAYLPLLLAAMVLVFSDLPSVPWLPSITTKATAATYVHKVKTPIPDAVSAGLSKLNDKGITATHYAKDTTDGAGEVPDQYKAAAAAATELPSLVVQAGDRVLRVVKSPTTEEQVLEAAQ
jgi:hypothetical protein